MVEIKCNKCGRSFWSQEIEIKRRTVDKDQEIIESYFKCPKCDTHYTVIVTDPESRRMIKDGRRAEAKKRSELLEEKYREVIEG